VYGKKEDTVTLREFMRYMQAFGQWKWFPLFYILWVVLPVAILLHHWLYG